MPDIEFDFAHASLDTFLDDDLNVADVVRLLKLHLLYYTFTETGQDAMVHLLKNAVRANTEDYKLINPDGGDICFVVRNDLSLLDWGGPLAIPRQPGPAGQGGHGPRHNSFFTGKWRGEQISHTGVHFVTKHGHHKAGGPDRSNQQLRQARMMGEQMQQLGRRSALALGSGDINASLPENREMQKVFDEYELTTTAEETDTKTATHGAHRIDYAWTYDKDRRLSVPSMRVLKNQGYHSDHDPLVVHVNVKKKAA